MPNQMPPRNPHYAEVDYPSPTHRCPLCLRENDGATHRSLCCGFINEALEGRSFFVFPLSCLTR